MLKKYKQIINLSYIQLDILRYQISNFMNKKYN